MKKAPDHSTVEPRSIPGSGFLGPERLLTLFMQLAACLLALKVLALWAFPQLPLLSDENGYLSLSETFFEIFPRRLNCWAPFQTGFLATIRMLTEDHFVGVARALQLGVHTATGGLLFLLTRRALGVQTAFAAGLLFLTLPEVVSMAYLNTSPTTPTGIEPRMIPQPRV